MIWLDRDTPARPVLRTRELDRRVERAWPVHPDAVTWSEFPAADTYGGDPFLFRTRRVVVAFESGWAASILWGTGSYSTNHDAWRESDRFVEAPHAVEVGVLERDKLLGEPLSYVDAGELVAVLELLERGGYELGDIDRARALERGDARDVE